MAGRVLVRRGNAWLQPPGQHQHEEQDQHGTSAETMEHDEHDQHEEREEREEHDEHDEQHICIHISTRSRSSTTAAA